MKSIYSSDHDANVAIPCNSKRMIVKTFKYQQLTARLIITHCPSKYKSSGYGVVHPGFHCFSLFFEFLLVISLPIRS